MCAQVLWWHFICEESSSWKLNLIYCVAKEEKKQTKKKERLADGETRSVCAQERTATTMPQLTGTSHIFSPPKAYTFTASVSTEGDSFTC